MTTATMVMPALSTLLRLGRISNLPTVWTNVIAASVIVGGAQWDQVAWLLPAMTAFYIGGMYLNDYFDRAIDARERPSRPIPAAEISANIVAAGGFGLLALGILLLTPFGLSAALSGLVLAATIVLYDVWHKGNALGPLVMGLCRALVYGSVSVALTESLSQAMLIGALALAAHVAGITYAAKQEDLDRIDHLWPLLLLAAPLLVALPLLSSPSVLVAFVLLLIADVSAVRLLAERPTPGAVSLAVSKLIAAICLVDALAVACSNGGIVPVALFAFGYPLTRAFQKFIPGT